MKAAAIFEGSEAAATRAYYAKLEHHCGPLGVVAMNLLRAQKASYRAKRYRGGVSGVGSFADMAYKRKNWALAQLCAALAELVDGRVSYGWGRDMKEPIARWVLYVDLPQGQVSFHSIERGAGPEYAGKWDGEHKSRERILEFCDYVSESAEQAVRTLFDALKPQGSEF